MQTCVYIYYTVKLQICHDICLFWVLYLLIQKSNQTIWFKKYRTKTKKPNQTEPNQIFFCFSLVLATFICYFILLGEFWNNHKMSNSICFTKFLDYFRSKFSSSISSHDLSSVHFLSPLLL